jgi:hypothetical protein
MVPDIVTGGFVKEPTSPRIVTSEQHSKHTWMRPIVLSTHSFINIPITLLSPVHRLNPSRRPPHEQPHKKPREQYLGSLKEPLNKTKEDHGSSKDANVFIPVQLIGTFMVRIFLTVLSSASVSVRTRLHSNIHLSTLPGVRL